MLPAEDDREVVRGFPVLNFAQCCMISAHKSGKHHEKGVMQRRCPREQGVPEFPMAIICPMPTAVLCRSL